MFLFERKHKSAPSWPSLSPAPGGRWDHRPWTGGAWLARVKEEGWALSWSFLRAKEEGHSGMEFGLVRQKVKLKNSTHMPTVQMGAKRHHLRVGTISGSWSQGPEVAPGPPIPRVPGWGAGQETVAFRSGGSQSNPSPHGKKKKKKILKKHPKLKKTKPPWQGELGASCLGAERLTWQKYVEK